MPTQNNSFETKIGHAKSAWRTGQLEFSVLVSQDGSTYVQIYAHDPTDRRKSGVILTMGQHEWEDFMQVLHGVQSGIARIQQAGQMRVFAVPNPSVQR